MDQISPATHWIFFVVRSLAKVIDRSLGIACSVCENSYIKGGRILVKAFHLAPDTCADLHLNYVFC